MFEVRTNYTEIFGKSTTSLKIQKHLFSLLRKAIFTRVCASNLGILDSAAYKASNLKIIEQSVSL